MTTTISAATGGLTYTTADTYGIGAGVTVSNSTATGSRPLTLGANNGASIILQNSGTVQSVAASSQEVIGSSTFDNITIQNYSGGVIQALGTGRAIRLDANITITNASGATISVVNNDAVKLTGANDTITNSGTIYAAAGGQAVDADGASALTLTNNAGATIQSGTATVSGEDAIKVTTGTVTNYGTIIGADEGVQGGAAANYTIVNYGTITAYDTPIASDVSATITNYGTLTSNSDDGVDLDGTGSLTNAGTIIARGSTDPLGYLGTETNEGVTMGGGTVVNSGTITSQHHGVFFVVSASSNQTQTAAGSLTNTGTITAETGYGVKFWGTSQNDALTNSGTIYAGSGVAVLMGAGNDTVTINGGRIVGSMNGEAGTDQITFGAPFTLEGAVANFETVSVTSGGVAFKAYGVSGATTLTVAAGASLSAGGGAIAAGTFTNNGGFALTSGESLTGNFSQSAGGAFTTQATLTVTGTVALNGALVLREPANGVIIANDGVDAVTGTFTGLAEGAEFQSGAGVYKITYVGGDGNDVAVTLLRGVGGASNPAIPGVSGGGGATAPVTFTDQADRVQSSDGPDYLSLGGGDDVVSAGGGADQVSGDQGNDSLDGGDGDDLLRGGQGADSLLGASGADSLYGGQGRDSLSGGIGADSLDGGKGDDSLGGGQGDDILRGGEGADQIRGGEGRDSLFGGQGADTFWGGVGADRFVFGGAGGADRIEDFNPSEGDRLQLPAGVSYSAAGHDGGVTLRFSNGDEVFIVGASTPSGDWFVFV